MLRNYLWPLIIVCLFVQYPTLAETPVRVLSIDGGGIKGVMEAVILTVMENELNRPLSQVFDLIAGSSTGGILALGLVVPHEEGGPRYRAAELIEVYADNAAKVFSSSFSHTIYTLNGLIGPKYQTTGLEELLNRYFGNLLLSQAVTPVMIMGYHIDGLGGIEFSSSDALAFPQDRDCLMKEVARATTAAPIFFKAANINFAWGTLKNVIDGGIFVNNPALNAYLRAKRMHPHRKIEVYSISSGNFILDRGMKVTSPGLVQGISPLISHLIIGNSASHNDILHKLLNENGETNFFRLNVWIDSEHKSLDDTSSNNINYLLNKGLEVTQSEIFMQIIERLKQNNY